MTSLFHLTGEGLTGKGGQRGLTPHGFLLRESLAGLVHNYHYPLHYPSMFSPHHYSSAPLSPLYNSHAEFKDFCSVYKGFCKQIIRMASHLAPEPALAITTEALRTTLASAESTATAGGAAVGARQQRLEAAVMVAEVRPP